MNKNEVSVILKRHNKTWKDFNDFMNGQTVGLKNGKIDYYECDVKHFLSEKGIWD